MFISGQRRRVAPKIKREKAFRHRAGHRGRLKSDRMGRNYLSHREGDATNAVLAAVGYDFRRLIRVAQAPVATIKGGLFAAPLLNPA